MLFRSNAETPYDALIAWFFESEGIDLMDDLSDAHYRDVLKSIKPLKALVSKYMPDLEQESKPFAQEMVLWGLEGFEKLSKNRISEGFRFRDLYGSYISGL